MKKLRAPSTMKWGEYITPTLEFRKRRAAELRNLRKFAKREDGYLERAALRARKIVQRSNFGLKPKGKYSILEIMDAHRGCR